MEVLHALQQKKQRTFGEQEVATALFYMMRECRNGRKTLVEKLIGKRKADEEKVQAVTCLLQAGWNTWDIEQHLDNREVLIALAEKEGKQTKAATFHNKRTAFAMCTLKLKD